MKKIIPPFLFLACIAFMVSIHWLIPSFTIFATPYNYSGIGLIVLGLRMTITVSKRFSENETEIHTFKNPQKLVTNGLFRLSRNPIYLGFALSLTGVWVLLGSFLPICGCIFFVLITNTWYIPYEEKVMLQTFGNAYEKYKSKVRRWV